MRQHFLIVIAEVRFVPFVDLRDSDAQHSSLYRSPRVNELVSCGVESCVDVVSSPRGRSQIWAAKGSTVESIVNSGVIPDRSNDSTFDIVQGKRFAKHCDGSFVVKGPNEVREFLFDLTNRGNRIVLQNQSCGFGVVQVEPESQLLITSQYSNVSSLKLLKVIVQLLAIAASDLAIAKPIQSRSIGNKIPCQKLIPDRVVDHVR